MADKSLMMAPELCDAEVQSIE